MDKLIGGVALILFSIFYYKIFHKIEFNGRNLKYKRERQWMRRRGYGFFVIGLICLFFYFKSVFFN